MHRVGGKDSQGIVLPGPVQGLFHRAMHIDHQPAIGPLGKQPVGILSQHLVIVDVAGRARLVGPLVIDRRSEMDDAGSGRLDCRMQPLDSGPKAGEPLGIERLVDATVHAITGQDNIGPADPQHPVETFVKIGSGKCSAGMAVFRKS